MARLNKQLQRQTAEASSGFEPIPDGVYHCRLRDVDTSGSGNAGPYWTWEFECVEEPYIGRRFWNNTSLSDKSAFVMRATYDAFEAPYDADTDDLCGQVVRLIVTTSTIQKGIRKGELQNQVKSLKPKDPEFVVPEQDTEAVGQAGSPGAPDDIF